MIAHLPNIITFARLLAVPMMVWLVLGGMMQAAFWLFVAAGVSDALDGFIAKRFHAETVIGGFLDPLADKALLVCAFITLGHEGFLPLWLVILVVFRDALIVGGAVLYQVLTTSLIMQPLMVSKINTATQLTLIAWVLADIGFGIETSWPDQLLIWLTSLTTVVSGGAYVWTWGRRAMAAEKE